MPAIEFGVKTGQGGYSFEDLRKVWSAAEDLGYDSVWLYDHFYSLGNKLDPCLEAWTALSALAALTERVKIGTIVTCVSYRQPSLLAKMGATVDNISHGRLVLGIGAGWHEEEYLAYGYEFPSVKDRIRALKEALIVIEKLWTEDKPSFQGEFYTLHEATCLPKPVQKPRPQIIVGITEGKKTMPYLASRYADGFNTANSSLDTCREILKAAEAYWLKYGKDPSKQVKSWQGFVLIGENAAEVEENVERAAKRRRQSVSEFRKTASERGLLMGQPDEIVKQLRKLREIGMNNLLFIFSGDTTIRPLELFRDKVIPQIR